MQMFDCLKVPEALRKLANFTNSLMKSKASSKVASKAYSKSAYGRTVSKGGGRVPRPAPRSQGGFSHLKVYMRYSTLSNQTMIEILLHIETIKNAALSEYGRLTGIRHPEILQPINFTYIATGRSVTFKYGGGLLPSIKAVDGKIEVSVSEKVAIPFLVAFFLFKAYAAYLDVGIKYKEKQSIDLDVAIKQLELEEKQEAKAEREAKRKTEVTVATENLLQYLINNPHIQRFEINNQPIKPLLKGNGANK